MNQKRKEYLIKWRIKNKDKMNAYHREYRKTHCWHKYYHYVKKGRRVWCEGLKLSIDHRKKISDASMGEKNHNWQGGITEKNRIIRKNIEYKLWRADVLKRDNYTCQVCDKSGIKLNAHHLKPFSLFPEDRFDINNGVTLCVKCHKKTDTYGSKVLLYNRGFKNTAELQ